jgi:DNA polymerase III alpha subunit
MFLNAHSWFSFQYGVMKPEALLEEAQKAGVRTLALTDINCTAGIPDFVRDAHRFEVRPVVGIEFRRGAQLLYIGIAKNNEGFQQLNELLSPLLLDDEALPDRAPELADAFFIYPFGGALRCCVRTNASASPRATSRACPSPRGRRTQDLVALLPVTFRHKRDHNTHRLLRTMAKNTVVSMVPPEEVAEPEEVFRSEEEVQRMYQDFPQLVQNTERLLEQCSIAFEGTDKTRKVFGTSEALDRERCTATPWWACATATRTRTEGDRAHAPRTGCDRAHGLHQLLPHQPGHRSFRAQQGLLPRGAGQWCQQLGGVLLGHHRCGPDRTRPLLRALHQHGAQETTRLSTSTSVGRTATKCTATCSTSTTAKVSASIHAAQIATYTTFQWRGAIRELGKAVGLPPGRDRCAERGQPCNYYARGRPSPHATSADLDKVAQAVIRYGKLLIGMPHHFGIHAGGIVITDKPVTHYTALHRPPKGFPVTQISMLECEDLGLHKFDLLSQRGLGHIYGMQWRW